MSKIERFEAIYARQSVEKEDSVSIETQIDDCKMKCENKDNVRIYQDKGFSGKNTERPDVQRLIHDIQQGIIKKVVVYKLDRISRNITDFYKLYEIMQANDCEFISRTENFDTTNSIGRAMMGILAVFAQMERENTQIRIKDNYQFRIKQGSWASGKAPFGFRNGKIEGVKTLIPVPVEMEIVKWMFNTYAYETNISLGQIQSKLIEKGFKGKQSKQGFSRTTLNHILTNPIYAVADELLYQYYQKKFIEFVNAPDQWDGTFAAAIVGKNGRSLRNENLDGIRIYITNVKGTIDSRTFIMVQERMEQNQQIASDNKPTNNLQELSGFLKCAECGSAIKMQTKPTMSCTGRSQKKICNVSFAGLKLETIQENVAIQIQEYLNNIHENTKQKQERQKKTLSEIAELEKQLNNLVELARLEGVSDYVKRDIEDLTIKIKDKQLKLKLDTAEDVISARLGMNKQFAYTSIFDKDGHVIFNYKDLAVDKKQAILRVLVNRILVHKDGTIDIDWRE
jgi:DNA invertase Pin-like site-specific DNA recombinase